MSNRYKLNHPNILNRGIALIACGVVLILGMSQTALARESRGKTRSSLAKMGARPAPEYKAHDIGTLWSVVSNYGSFGDPAPESTGNPTMQWPAGKRSNYLYDASIMATTIVNGEKWNTSYFYDTEEWEPSEGTAFLRGSEEVATVTTPKSILDTWAAFDDLAPDPDHFPLGLQVIRQGLSWSMPKYDDFIAYEIAIINTGLNGNLSNVYFSFWYDLDVATIDVSDAHIDDLVDFDGWDGVETQTDEIDLVDPHDLDGNGETGYDTYGWPFGDPRNVESDGGDIGYQPERIEPDGVFDEYTLLIDPNGPPVFADIDVTIGDLEISLGDTLKFADGSVVKGYKVPRGVSYIYDYDNPTSSDNDVGERDLTPPTTGFAGGRVIYADPTTVDYYFENPDSLHERIPRPFSHQWWNWESDPSNDAEFYDYIVGQHEFSQGFRYLPNPLDLNAPTFDYRFLQSVGPYDISTGDTVRIVWVECVGEGIEGLRANMDNALAAYYTGSEKGSPYVPTGPDDDVHWRLPAPPATPNLSYSPGNNKVKLVWDNIAEVTPDTKTKEIDFAGYKIYRALYSPSNWTLISAMFDTDMFPGDTIHVTNTDGDTLGWVLKSSAPQLTHSFTDSGGVTFWGNTIEAPINGLPYYYSVVAFDAGDPITGLPPAESGKNNYKKNAGGGPEPIVPKAIYEGSKTDFDLSNVKVVPNPYKGTAPFEEIYTSQINFINLPPAAKIMIFSMTGDLIDTIYHDDGTDSESWHLLSRNEQNIVSGLYLFVVETTTDKYIGKFVVIR